MVCRILVADDSSTIQKVIRIGLAAIPNDIKTVSSFVEASKLAAPGQFDLIIADAGLPGVSTASDFVRLAERFGHLPLIILMGSYDAVRESDLRAVGIQHIIKKPFPPGELPQLVQTLVQSSSFASTGKAATAESPSPGAPIPFSLADQGDLRWSAAAPSDAHGGPEFGTLPGTSLPAFDLGGEGTTLGVPLIPEVEPARKGRPAFSDQEPSVARPQARTGVPNPMAGIPSMPVADLGASEIGRGSPVAGVSAAMESLVRDELPVLVDRAVERYCAEHFRGIAREVLTAELRRLAEEKARYLVDQ
jgi:CheY-like chemotaxis protein